MLGSSDSWRGSGTLHDCGVDYVGSTRMRQGNPFPGLRPFEPNESSLFFGRDEQCDELLTRLGGRRLVAVVGMSGSGKSSLVRAGLLPAFDRGYLPSAGSSWHIAIFRPGSDPVAKCRARSRRQRRSPEGPRERAAR
jgi:Novel STAND NTPase 1